jgi:hypothetical protein
MQMSTTAAFHKSVEIRAHAAVNHLITVDIHSLQHHWSSLLFKGETPAVFSELEGRSKQFSCT